LLPVLRMAKCKGEKEAATPVGASKRTKGSKVPIKNNPASDKEGSDKPEDLAFVCKPLRPVILEDEKEEARLRANLEKMGCEGLLDFPWNHEEEKWL
jgi:hypothetical protein